VIATLLRLLKAAIEWWVSMKTTIILLVVAFLPFCLAHEHCNGIWSSDIMDPLSIIASSLALAHAAHVSINAVKAARKAGPELLAFYNEISDMLVVLEELRAVLQHRAEFGERLPPIAGLLLVVESTRLKLEQIVAQLRRWNREIDPAPGGQQQVRLRALRIGRQAKKFRGELREIKDRLSSVLEIVSV
jgi:hypothetical protein